MAITIELPPQMEKEARDHTMLEDGVLEKLFLDYLAKELARRRDADKALSELDALIGKSRGRLSGQPYKFDRADAYEPETPYA